MSSKPDPDPDPNAGWKPAPAALALFCEYLRGLEVQPDLSFAGVVKANPQSAGDLTLLLEQYERVTGILESLSPTASFSVRLRERYGDEVDPGISLSGDRVTRPTSGTSGPHPSGRVLSRLSAQQASTGRYETLGELARGGMGAIMEVWDKELRRTLAMKVVLGGKTEPGSSQSSEDQVERRLSRFLEEAQITGQLDHPGIVPVHDIGLDDTGRVYFTMQLVDGHDLRKVFELARLQQDGWSLSRVLSVFVRVCEAMAYAHSKGVVHRDLKPANIMVGAFGEAFVMDWGLAKVIGVEPKVKGKGKETRKPRRKGSTNRVDTDRSDSDSDEGDALRTLDGDVVGTPAYMSPEQARGQLEEVGVRSDIYSLCAMLYHLLSGQAPFEPLGEKVPAHTILDAVRKAPPWPLAQIDPEVDGELAAICEKGMAREISERYASMMALGDDLRAWVEGRGVDAYTTGTFYALRKWVSRNRKLAITGAIIPLVVFLSLIVFSVQQRQNIEKILAEQQLTERARDEAESARKSADEHARSAQESESAMRLALKEKDLEAQHALAESKRADAEAFTAETQTKLANFNRSRAERIAYRSSITAAAYSLRLDDAVAARDNLEACGISMRGWEWNHVDIRVDASVGEKIRIRSGVADLAVNQAGTTLLTYGFAQNPQLWDVRQRQAGAVNIPFAAIGLGVELDLLRCALSPRGGTLAVTNPDQNSFWIFNARTGDELFTVGDHKDSISALAYSENGKYILTASLDGTSKVFSASGLQQLGTIEASESALLDAAFDPAGERVATCGEDRELRVHSFQGELLGTLAGHHTAPISSLDWSTDGKRIVTGDQDGGIAVWDVEAEQILTVMRGHRGGVRDVLFRRDGLSVFSASEDRTVRMWNAETGFEERVFTGHSGDVRALVRLGEGDEIVSAGSDRSLRVWSPHWNPGMTYLGTPANQSYVTATFAGDNRTVYAGTSDASVEAFDGHSTRALAGYGTRNAPDPSIHTVQAVARTTGRYAVGTTERTLEIYSGVDGVLEQQIDGFKTAVEKIAISDDGKHVVAGGRRGTVFSINLETNERVGIKLRYGLVALAISADGTQVATAEFNERLRLWDANTGEQLGDHRDAHSGTVTDLAFSEDGKSLVSAAKGPSAKFWKLPGLDYVGPEFGGHSEFVSAVTVSPDGSRVVTGSLGGRVRLWAEDGHDLLLTVRVSSGPVLDLDFSPDGKRLVVVTEQDGILILESEADGERYALRIQ